MNQMVVSYEEQAKDGTLVQRQVINADDSVSIVVGTTIPFFSVAPIPSFFQLAAGKVAFKPMFRFSPTGGRIRAALSSWARQRGLAEDRRKIFLRHEKSTWGIRESIFHS